MAFWRKSLAIPSLSIFICNTSSSNGVRSISGNWNSAIFWCCNLENKWKQYPSCTLYHIRKYSCIPNKEIHNVHVTMEYSCIGTQLYIRSHICFYMYMYTCYESLVEYLNHKCWKKHVLNITRCNNNTKG